MHIKLAIILWVVSSFTLYAENKGSCLLKGMKFLGEFDSHTLDEKGKLVRIVKKEVLPSNWNANANHYNVLSIDIDKKGNLPSEFQLTVKRYHANKKILFQKKFSIIRRQPKPFGPFDELIGPATDWPVTLEFTVLEKDKVFCRFVMRVEAND